jgi:hypothetical protein
MIRVLSRHHRLQTGTLGLFKAQIGNSKTTTQLNIYLVELEYIRI